MNKRLLVGKIVVMAICVVILAWVGLQFFVLDKEMKINYNFSERSDRISGLMPWYRLTPIEDIDGDSVQYVKDSLVYFVAKIPPNFDEAEVMVKYKGNADMKLGAELAKNNYQYMETENYDNDGWKIAKVNFDIREVFLSNYLIENNKLKFAISALGINEDNRLAITGIDIVLKKSGLTRQGMENAWTRIKKKL